MTPVEKMFFWLPRIVSIGFVLFLSVFALDVFSEYSGMQVVLPFLIHLIPSFVLLGAVLLAWRYDLVGVVIFFGFALLYVWDVGFDRPWSWYAGIVAPAAVVGLLFLVSWLQKRGRARLSLSSDLPRPSSEHAHRSEHGKLSPDGKDAAEERTVPKRTR